MVEARKKAKAEAEQKPPESKPVLVPKLSTEVLQPLPVTSSQATTASIPTATGSQAVVQQTQAMATPSAAVALVPASLNPPLPSFSHAGAPAASSQPAAPTALRQTRSGLDLVLPVLQSMHSGQTQALQRLSSGMQILQHLPKTSLPGGPAALTNPAAVPAQQSNPQSAGSLQAVQLQGPQAATSQRSRLPPEDFNKLSEAVYTQLQRTQQGVSLNSSGNVVLQQIQGMPGAVTFRPQSSVLSGPSLPSLPVNSNAALSSKASAVSQLPDHGNAEQSTPALKVVRAAADAGPQLTKTGSGPKQPKPTPPNGSAEQRLLSQTANSQFKHNSNALTESWRQTQGSFSSPLDGLEIPSVQPLIARPENAHQGLPTIGSQTQTATPAADLYRQA